MIEASVERRFAGPDEGLFAAGANLNIVAMTSRPFL